MNKTMVCLDFDNTICSCDSMTELTLEKCGEIGVEKMENEINYGRKNLCTFEEIYHKNIKALMTNKKELQEFGSHILNNFINKDKIEFVHFLKKNGFDVCVTSGGIYEIINEFSLAAGIPLNSVMLNYEENGNYKSINNENLFANDKWIGIKKCNFINKYEKTILIGDGMNDYRVFENKQCNYYIKYKEFLDNKEIPDSSFVCSNISELEDIFANNFINR